MVDARILLTGFLALTLGGCLGGTSKPPAYYLLTARAASPATASPNTRSTPLSIGVGPVRVAPFLMRPQIVTHAGSGDLIVADARRWSEPLEQGIQRVLLQNLATLTQGDMRNFPWTQTTVPDYAVRIDVFDFDRNADGKAVLEVHWILEDVKQGKLLDSHSETFSATLPAGAIDYTALAATYSDLLAQLAQRVANVLPAR